VIIVLGRINKRGKYFR